MSEADRIAQAKTDRARAAREALESENADRERQRRARAIATAQRAIPVVLAKLEVAGFPGVAEVQVYEKRRVGKPKARMKGGWVICQVQSLHYGELASFPVHLLSDGRLLHCGSAKSPDEIIVPDHDKKRNQEQLRT